MREFWHSEIEVWPPPQALEPGPYRGFEQVTAFMESQLESFDEWRFEVEDILATGRPDELLALVDLHGRGRGSGVEVTISIAHRIQLENGKLRRLEVVPSQDEALAAAGLKRRPA